MIDLYLVSGFFGAGKTSFIRQVVTQTDEMETVGLVLNEYGNISVDSRYIGCPEIVRKEINGGAVFGEEYRQDFVQALLQLNYQGIERLFIESSALSETGMMPQLAEDLLPYCVQMYDYRGEICVVDAANIDSYLKYYVQVKHQIASADLLLVNKTDLADEGQLEKIHQMLSAINPLAEIIDTIDGRITDAQLEALTVREKEVPESKRALMPNPMCVLVQTKNDSSIAELQAFIHKLLPLTVRIKGFCETKEGLLHVDTSWKQLRMQLCEVCHNEDEEQLFGLTVVMGKQCFIPEDALEQIKEAAEAVLTYVPEMEVLL